MSKPKNSEEQRMSDIANMMGKILETVAPKGVKVYLVAMDDKAWAIYNSGGEYALANAVRAVETDTKLHAEPETAPDPFPAPNKTLN